MYGWGADTSGFKNPGAYKFDSAKAPYLEDFEKQAKAKGSKRTYNKIKEPILNLVDPKGKTLTTQATNVIIWGQDGTRSYQDWPAEIFDRLPLFFQTLGQYRPDLEMLLSVIGDAAFPDNWPLQVAPFGKGPALDDYLKALKPEGAGGPGMRESYELWAYFMHEHVATPNATKPFMMLYADEKFYDEINPAQVKKYIGDTIAEPIPSEKIWKGLAQKNNLYVFKKAYPRMDDKIREQWNSVLEPGHLVPIDKKERAVDVAMGIVAETWGKFSDFEKNLEARQDEQGIGIVMDSLRAASIKTGGKK